MTPLPLVRTSFGLIPIHRAAEVEQIAKDHESRRKDATQAEIEAGAVALGLKIAEVRALWADGPAIVDRAIKSAVAAIPAPLFRATYVCAGCKKVRDDKYAAKCKSRGRQPCWIPARLRGCARFEPAPVVG